MTDESTCPTLRDGDDEVARQWVEGSLSPEDAKAFEAHQLTCHRCQRAVEHAAGVTAALRAAASAHLVRRTGDYWRWVIPIAIAVGAVGLWFTIRS
jgi:hypothetical protein